MIPNPIPPDLCVHGPIYLLGQSGCDWLLGLFLIWLGVMQIRLSQTYVVFYVFVWLAAYLVLACIRFCLDDYIAPWAALW